MLPDVESALEEALAITDAHGVRALLVGAWARDLCLPADVRSEPRKTNDADLAVLVDDWKALDALFDAAASRFDVRRGELFLRHRERGVKVDLVPCGRIENPSGKLRLRDSTRVLNTTGLAASFETATRHAVRERSLLVPRPSGYALLKLLSFLDRRAPRDLRDLGYVAIRHPFDPNAIWDDVVTRDALASQSIVYEDLPVWYLGRDLRASFDVDVVDAFRRSLDAVADLDPWHRGLLMAHVVDAEQRLARADRMIRALRASVD